MCFPSHESSSEKVFALLQRNWCKASKVRMCNFCEEIVVGWLPYRQRGTFGEEQLKGVNVGLSFEERINTST